MTTKRKKIKNFFQNRRKKFLKYFEKNINFHLKEGEYLILSSSSVIPTPVEAEVSPLFKEGTVF